MVAPRDALLVRQREQLFVEILKKTSNTDDISSRSYHRSAWVGRPPRATPDRTNEWDLHRQRH